MVGVLCVITGCHHLAEQVINTRSRIAGHLLGTFNGIIQRRQQYPTLHSQFIERATLYQRLQCPTIHFSWVRPRTQIEQTGKRPVTARRQQ